jgi:sphinganine C4-monooxygenase
MNVTLPLSYTSAFEGPAAGACPVPWYYSPKSSLVAGISDSHFTLLFPVVTYWAWSAMYEVMDRSDWAARYRIHSLEFAEARNRATKGVVARAVLLQQLGQIILGYWWVNEAPLVPQALHCARADAWAVTMFGALARTVGPAAARDSAPSLGYFLHWWAVPILKIVFAM